MIAADGQTERGYYARVWKAKPGKDKADLANWHVLIDACEPAFAYGPSGLVHNSESWQATCKYVGSEEKWHVPKPYNWRASSEILIGNARQ
jgi:hypothetical protein